MMKVWITRYALTTGIEGHLEGEVDTNISERMVTVPRVGDSYGRRDHYHSPDWHTSREAAVERAEQMRLAKIASHERSIAKLKKLSFGATLSQPARAP